VTSARRLNSYSYEQYVNALVESHIKLEYFEGEIYAMAGGTVAHARLGAKMIGIFERGLVKPCAVYSSDLKVVVEQADLATFPDASVVCGPLMATARDRNCITNPIVLVEVTSPSTENFDRGEKLRCYQQLPSLKVILLVSHRSRRVSVAERGSGAWTMRDWVGGEVVELAEPRIRFAVDDLYEDVSLEA
jgi:Uma2 family endonuclease